MVVFLFGSQLDGRTWAESDLDLGVRWEVSHSLEERMAAERSFVASRGARRQVRVGSQRGRTRARRGPRFTPL
jgi:predicted nucleotidyltransferase